MHMMKKFMLELQQFTHEWDQSDVNATTTDASLNNVPCHMKKVQKKEEYFFYSTETAAGDEIGHDFIALVKKSKISFTGFCSEMTR